MVTTELTEVYVPTRVVTENEIEDEYDFLLVCPTYIDLRTIHIKKYIL